MPSADFAHTFLNNFIRPQVPPPQPGSNTSFQDYADFQSAQKKESFRPMPYSPQPPTPSSYPSFRDYADFQSAQKKESPGTMPYGPQPPAPSSYPSFQDYANFR